MSPRLSVRAVVIIDGNILLSKYKDSEGYWYVIPGGGVEHGETLEEAFYREIQEECGVNICMGELLFIREWISGRHNRHNLPNDLHQVEINFVGKVSSSDVQPSSPDIGQVATVWHPLSELNEIRFYPSALVNNFQKQSWPKRYVGDLP